MAIDREREREGEVSTFCHYLADYSSDMEKNPPLSGTTRNRYQAVCMHVPLDVCMSVRSPAEEKASPVIMDD